MLPYKKSSRCVLLVDEVADVAIEIYTTSAVWALNSCPDSKNFGSSCIEGEGGGPDFGFLVSPLMLSQSTLGISGFSTAGKGRGPAYRGRLLITLHIWAAPDTSKITLATDNSVAVRFCFGESNQLLTGDPGQFLVKPWDGGAGGTVFDWPNA